MGNIVYPNQIVNGDVFDANPVWANYEAIKAVLNGNLTSVNIKDGSITQDKLASDIELTATLDRTSGLTYITQARNQAFVSSGWRLVEYDTEVVDASSNFNATSDASTQRAWSFKPTTAGYYLIGAQVGVGSESDSQDYDAHVAIYLNGAIYSELYERIGQDNRITQNVETIINLSTSDYVQVYVYYTSGALGVINDRNSNTDGTASCFYSHIIGV